MHIVILDQIRVSRMSLLLVIVFSAAGSLAFGDVNQNQTFHAGIQGNLAEAKDIVCASNITDTKTCADITKLSLLIARDRRLSDLPWFEALSALFQAQLRKVQEMQKSWSDVDKSTVASRTPMEISRKVSLSRQGQGSFLPPLGLDIAYDTPCGDVWTCSFLALDANKCSFQRKALSMTYELTNIITHLFGVVVSVLCGCVHGKTSFCALRLLPVPCVFPHSLYSKLLSANMELWESVKGSTRKCILHGGVGISSVAR